MLKFSLIEDNLSRDSDGCVATVVETEFVDRNYIIDKITGAGSILKPTECNAVLKSFFKQLCENVSEGIGYRDEYITISFSVKGKFVNSDDNFDKNRHSVAVLVNSSAKIKDAVKDTEVVKVKRRERKPNIDKVYDNVLDSTNDSITAGCTIDISGSMLKLDLRDPRQGVYFIDDKVGDKVKVERVIKSTAKLLRVIVPKSLNSGKYYIEVINVPKNNKEPKSGRFSEKLNVI